MRSPSIDSKVVLASSHFYMSELLSPSTALLLRTEMSILKAEHMRPLFPEVTAASPEAQFLKTGRQMKDMDIIFPLTPHTLL